MEQKLQSCLSNKILFLAAFILGIFAKNASAQTTLSAGDLTIVTVNADAPGNFDFIPLVDLETGTVIHFTDDAWVNDLTAFQGREGTVTFTARGFIPAGTVVSFDTSLENGFAEADRSYNLSASGDNLIVYQGDKSSPIFIYGISWGQGDLWEYKNGSTSRSDIPPGLSREGNTILSLGTAGNFQYNTENGTEGTKNLLLGLVGNENNWNGNDITTFPAFSSPFTLLAQHISTNEITDTGNEAQNIVINEFLTSPVDSIDANGDGAFTNEDEFVEILNKGASNVNISGWKFAYDKDGSPAVQYTFPRGTVIPAGEALVLFAGGSPNGYFGDSIIHTIESISLKNAEEALYLLNEIGRVVDKIFYRESLSGESLVRNTDSTLVAHSTVAGAEGYVVSPGTKADGSSFASGYSAGIRGDEGWRMISAPTQNTSFADLLGRYRMQGISGSDAPADTMPNIYKWNEALGIFRETPASMAEEMEAGKGYIVYFFADDNPSSAMPGIQGGFPKMLTSTEVENNSSVPVKISVTDQNDDGEIGGDEGWNLLGNPFAVDILVGEVKNALGTVGDSLNANIYIWNPAAGEGNGQYEILEENDTISPYQAFFVKYMGSSEVNSATVNFSKIELAAKRDIGFYKEIEGAAFKFSIDLYGEKHFDTYYLEFGNQGNVELDRFDGFKHFSLNANSIAIYSPLGNYKLQKNELPFDLETPLEIPLIFNAPEKKNLTLRWNSIEEIPPDWQVTLIDKAVNREIDLTVVREYRFDLFESSAKLLNSSKEKPLLNKQKFNDDPIRFVLSITPPSKLVFSEDKLPDSIKLNPNYPNPFSQSTTVPFELVEDSEVTLTIWNMIGQKVATLVDGMEEAGEHDEVRWNASNMPSGIYIARLEVAGEVFIRKMTLIK